MTWHSEQIYWQFCKNNKCLNCFSWHHSLENITSVPSKKGKIPGVVFLFFLIFSSHQSVDSPHRTPKGYCHNPHGRDLSAPSSSSHNTFSTKFSQKEIFFISSPELVLEFRYNFSHVSVIGNVPLKKSTQLLSGSGEVSLILLRNNFNSSLIISVQFTSKMSFWLFFFK